MKEVMKRIIELAFEINSILSEYFVYVDLKPRGLQSEVYIFNAMTKRREVFSGDLYDECLPARLIFAEGRLGDILKELQRR